MKKLIITALLLSSISAFAGQTVQALNYTNCVCQGDETSAYCNKVAVRSYYFGTSNNNGFTATGQAPAAIGASSALPVYNDPTEGPSIAVGFINGTKTSYSYGPIAPMGNPPYAVITYADQDGQYPMPIPLSTINVQTCQVTVPQVKMALFAKH